MPEGASKQTENLRIGVAEPYQAYSQIRCAPVDFGGAPQRLTEQLATCRGDSCRQIEGQ